MIKPVRPNPMFFSLLLLGSLALGGCAAQPIEEPAVQAPIEPPAVPVVEETRPFPPESFYDLLVAEFALRRNSYELALGNYLQQAHATHDAGVIARAARLAQFLKADRAALDASALWVVQEPDDMEARFTLASQLAKAQRPLEAMPHMVKVLEAGD